MLDRTKLIHDIRVLADRLFPDRGVENDLARQQWALMAKDETFRERVEQAKSSFLVPGWHGNLADTVPINRTMTGYTVLAVDGSQIYPDRHVAGAGCFLLNTGGVILKYGQKSSVELFSTPRIFLPEDVLPKAASPHFSIDLVDLKREELELIASSKKMKELVANGVAKKAPLVCFVDGTIVFWSLESKQPDIKNAFLKSYFLSLDQFYRHNIPVAGYISLPKSKELVNLVKLSLCRFDTADCIPCHSAYSTFPCKAVDSLIDTMVVRSFLPQYHRTTLFSSSSKVVELYPEHLRPYFFYLDVGKEIIRIEIPAWVADNQELVDRVSAVAFDQSSKGQGYPVCLAEAHEQAVVKGGDREFFFHLICKIGIERNRRVFMSQKSVKKRGMGI